MSLKLRKRRGRKWVKVWPASQLTEGFGTAQRISSAVVQIPIFSSMRVVGTDLEWAEREFAADEAGKLKLAVGERLMCVQSCSGIDSGPLHFINLP